MHTNNFVFHWKYKYLVKYDYDENSVHEMDDAAVAVLTQKTNEKMIHLLKFS